MDCFSLNYTQARSKFIKAALAGGAALDSIQHCQRGPLGEELAIDVAWFGAASAHRVFVATSGTHGVEGFFGSATQVEWMVRGEYGRLPNDSAALLIHAVNPFGFAWLRRTNEDNVDLNRNWIDFGSPAPVNLEYEELAADLCPSSWSPDAQAVANARIDAWRDRRGDKAYLQAVSGGQWSHPDGIFFGGTKPSWSCLSLRRILDSYLSKAGRILTIDFHTGLGSHGYVEPIISCRTDLELSRTRAWIGTSATSDMVGDSASADVQGDFLSALPSLLPSAKVDAVCLECGVQPIDRVANALRADNWLHAHGDPGSPEAVPIKKLIRDAFYSESLMWQGMALGQGLAACRAAIGCLSLLPE